jgi:2-polyprenyl-6-methoxyphenol hydroxylase-like FAD-dependent oxidoreductase
VSETASLVIGADGKRSFVAGAVGAGRYCERPVQAFVTYSYWSGVPAPGGEIYQRPGRAVAVYPTNDQLTMIYLATPITEFASARTDLEGNYLRAFDLCGDLGDRVRSGTRVERLRTTPDQPNMFRQPHGPGWALVGDAGVVMDSLSAQGMSHALRDADYLCTAVVAGLGGSRPLAAALQEHQHRRDQAIRGMYDFTFDIASFPRLTFFRRLFYAAVASDQRQTDRLLGVLAGTVPADEYFSPAAMLSILRSIGIQKLVTAEANQVFARLRQRRPAGHPRVEPRVEP